MDEEIEKFIIEVSSIDKATDSASEFTDYSDTDTADEYWPRGYKIKRHDWLLADMCPQVANH